MDFLLKKISEPKDLGPSPRTIHATPCELCPSTKGTDPETEEIMACALEERLKTVFRCAWRPNKLCKGYCDKVGATEENLRNVDFC